MHSANRETRWKSYRRSSCFWRLAGSSVEHRWRANAMNKSWNSTILGWRVAPAVDVGVCFLAIIQLLPRSWSSWVIRQVSISSKGSWRSCRPLAWGAIFFWCYTRGQPFGDFNCFLSHVWTKALGFSFPRLCVSRVGQRSKPSTSKDEGKQVQCSCGLGRTL